MEKEGITIMARNEQSEIIELIQQQLPNLKTESDFGTFTVFLSQNNPISLNFNLERQLIDVEFSDETNDIMPDITTIEDKQDLYYIMTILNIVEEFIN